MDTRSAIIDAIKYHEQVIANLKHKCDYALGSNEQIYFAALAQYNELRKTQLQNALNQCSPTQEFHRNVGGDRGQSM